VVTALRDQISAGGVDILAGHSQGSVIAAVATQQAAAEEGNLPTGLLTYGSPITLLYRKLFPDTGIEGLVVDLPAKLPEGWTNLSRPDDPIGGDALGGSVIDTAELEGSGHSGYELTKAFRAARDQLS
jgi:pimeloyl-ACP methyl ester carboxylesterase